MAGAERVRVDGATVRYGATTVLRDVSLALEAGQLVGVRGANGVGKTTLLRVLAGVLRPQSGRRHGPRSCAYVPGALAPPLLSPRRWLRGVRQDHVEDPVRALDQLGFDGDLTRSCRALSFGNLRKVLLAEALTAATGLVVLDEAFAGLDAHGHRGLTALVDAARARAVTVVVAAHEDQAIERPDRVLVIASGVVHETAGTAPGTVIAAYRGPSTGRAQLDDAARALGFDPDDRAP